MGREDRVGAAQQWLTLHGYDVSINNRMDSKTVAALQQFDAKLGSADPGGISEALFTKLYLSIPVTRETFGKRQKMNEYFARMQKGATEPEERKATAKAAKTQAAPAVSQKQAPAAEAAAVQHVQEVAQVQAAAEPVAQKKAAATAAAPEAAAAPTTPSPAAVSPPATAAAAAAAKPAKKFGRQLTADDW
jgi:hypothetical protein